MCKVTIQDSVLCPERATNKAVVVAAPGNAPVRISVTDFNRALTAIPRRRFPATIDSAQLSEPQQFPFLHETAGGMEITVPFGHQYQKVSALTFKTLVGQPADTLLRQNGVKWQVVGNAEMIDLTDKTVVYKVGPVQIYS